MRAARLHLWTAMRSFALAVGLSVCVAGCAAQLAADRRHRSPRREAGHVALGGVTEAVVGSLILVGSYYWYKSLDRNPEPVPPPDDEGNTHYTSPKLFPVLGFIAGGALVGSSVADETIAAWQVMSNDYVLTPLQPEPSAALRKPPPAEPFNTANGSASPQETDEAYTRWLAKQPPMRNGCSFKDC